MNKKKKVGSKEVLAYGIGLGWLGCECQNYLLRQPAWAEVSGRGTLLRDRDWESPSCTHRPPLADLLEAAVGGVVGKAKVWECSERDHRSSPSGTMQEPGGPELLLRQSLAAAEEPFACPGASALSPDREVSRQASGDCSRTERAALGAGCEVVF